MDKMVATGLGITWDPTTVIHMESAHGQVQPTEGLARNVPFRFGEITVYLQVHIINKAPYQVLLGRPFDAFTESLVKNFANGEQEITIICPNTGKKCTMPVTNSNFLFSFSFSFTFLFYFPHKEAARYDSI